MNRLIPTTDFYDQVSQLSQSRLEQTRAQASFNMGDGVNGTTFINPEIINIKVQEPVDRYGTYRNRNVPMIPKHAPANANTAIYDLRSNGPDEITRSVMLQEQLEKGRESARNAITFSKDERIESVAVRPHEHDKYVDVQTRFNIQKQFDNSEYLRNRKQLAQDAWWISQNKGTGEKRYGINNYRKDRTETQNVEAETPSFDISGMTVSGLDGTNDTVREQINTDASNYTRTVPKVMLKTNTGTNELTDVSLMNTGGLRNKSNQVNMDPRIVLDEGVQREKFYHGAGKHIEKHINDQFDRVAHENIVRRNNNRYVESDEEQARINSIRDRISYNVPVKENYENEQDKSILDRITDAITGFFTKRKNETSKVINERYSEMSKLEASNANKLTDDQRVNETNEVHGSRLQLKNEELHREGVIRTYNDSIRRDFLNNQTQQIIKTVVETGAAGSALEGYDIFKTLIYDHITGEYILAQTLKMRKGHGRMGGVLTDETIMNDIKNDTITRKIILTDDLVNELALKINVDINRIKRIMNGPTMLEDEHVKDEMLKQISIYVDVHQDTDDRIKVIEHPGRIHKELLNDDRLKDIRYQNTLKKATEGYSMESKMQREKLRNRSAPTRDSFNTQEIGAREQDKVKSYANVRFGKK